VADRHFVSLAPGAVTTDVTTFDQALLEQDWERAVEICQGPLLPGFYEDPLPQMSGEYEEKARAAFQARLEGLEKPGLENQGLRRMTHGSFVR
jgi:hypothetical protein